MSYRMRMITEMTPQPYDYELGVHCREGGAIGEFGVRRFQVLASNATEARELAMDQAHAQDLEVRAIDIYSRTKCPVLDKL